MVEGTRAVREALDAGAHLRAVFAGPGAPADLVADASAAGAAVHRVEPGVMERVATTVSPQPVVAVADQLDVAIDALVGAPLVVVAVGLHDPGNLGTLLRTAEAAGAGGVVCCGSHVDVYNPKTVRAASGALFHVPVVVAGDPVEVLRRLREWGMKRVAAVARGGTDHTAADLRGPVALVVGSEAAGLPEAALAEVDELITIPMAGRAESLNVGMAAAVLCFEVARQRREGGVDRGGS